MSILRKISVFTMLFVMSILFLAPVSANAATVGDILTSPEDGWQRIDDTDSSIIYSGTWVLSGYFSDLLNNHQHDTTTINSSYKFKFYGSKLRLLTNKATSSSSIISVVIDGTNYSYSAYGTTGTFNYIVFEKIGLNLGYHTVSVTNLQNSKYMNIDAIDIDDTGYLVDYYQPTNLIATSGTNEINLSWDAVDDATSYNIKRSTTAGGPYETIATSSAINFTDSDVEAGTTYYYVVSAVVSDTESADSNEASATPTAEETPSTDHEGNYSTLILSMTNGDDKEYDLTINDLDDFITWYVNRSIGTGNSYYIFNITDSIAPYVSVKEYIAFDKISSFEVKEFNQ